MKIITTLCMFMLLLSGCHKPMALWQTEVQPEPHLDKLKDEPSLNLSILPEEQKCQGLAEIFLDDYKNNLAKNDKSKKVEFTIVKSKKDSSRVEKISCTIGN